MDEDNTGAVTVVGEDEVEVATGTVVAGTVVAGTAVAGTVVAGTVVAGALTGTVDVGATVVTGAAVVGGATGVVVVGLIETGRCGRLGGLANAGPTAHPQTARMQVTDKSPITDQKPRNRRRAGREKRSTVDCIGMFAPGLEDKDKEFPVRAENRRW